jgi:hypothetical protein
MGSCRAFERCSRLHIATDKVARYAAIIAGQFWQEGQLRENKDLLRRHIFATGATDECKLIVSDMHQKNDSFRVEVAERGTKTTDKLGEDTKRFIDQHMVSAERRPPAPSVRRDAAAEHAPRFSGRKPGQSYL